MHIKRDQVGSMVSHKTLHKYSPNKSPQTTCFFKLLCLNIVDFVLISIQYII